MDDQSTDLSYEFAKMYERKRPNKIKVLRTKEKKCAGGARNAGILAVQILAGSDPELARQLVSFKHKLVEKIAAKDAAFQEKLANS